MIDRSRTIARLQFLGGQRIELGNEIVTPDAERLFAMIVRLSVPLGRIASRQTMMDTLWPGADDANARHNLRQTVYKAREIGLVVESGEDGLRLDPRHWSADWEDAEGDIAGPWLPDYQPRFSDELASWVISQRIGVHALIRPRLIRSLQRSRSSGDLMRADRYAVQLLEIDELNEEATLTHAETLALHGAKVDALRLLDAYLTEVGRLGAGRDASLPAHVLRRRIAEKLPVFSYQTTEKHHGPLVKRAAELQRLIAGVFDARAGRGGAVLLHGPEGCGKTRLLHELRNVAILQGVRVLNLPVESRPLPTPFATMRELITRLLDLPGAIGISPESLEALHSWLASRDIAPDDCPLYEVEDLMNAIAEETPLLIQIEHAERSDAETIASLDRIYRGGVSRHHMLMLTTSSRSTPAESPVDLKWIERLSLRRLSAADILEILESYARVEGLRVSSDQMSYAAVFAEGIPMFGIEMLGLLCDNGAPDKVPWRVQVAVERSLRELSQPQLRILSLANSLGKSSRHSLLLWSLQLDDAGLALALDELELCGHLQIEGDALIAAGLIADAARTRVRANELRADALRCALALSQQGSALTTPVDFYSCLRLLVIAHEEARATTLIDESIGAIVRADTAENVVFELERIRSSATSQRLKEALDGVREQILAGAESKRPSRNRKGARGQPTSLASVSRASIEVEYTLSSDTTLSTALWESRDPNLPAEKRLSEAAMALALASNLGDLEALKGAHQTVDGLRHSPDANPFDLHRADLIYFASMGLREDAIRAASCLAKESRIVKDVQLSCKGLRNAAELFHTFGDISQAQSLLHESRRIASTLQYSSQLAWADLRLAELAIEMMDADGASAYIESAAATIERKSLISNLLVADLNLFRCWESLLRGDVSRAQRASRAVARNMPTARSGTSLWIVLCVKLAVHRGAHSKEMARDFETLKSSIGSRPFYPSEQLSLAGLLAYSRNCGAYPDTPNFIRDQLPRLKDQGRTIWPFILELLGDRERSEGFTPSNEAPSK